MTDEVDQNTILITGGAGFIGSNFIAYFLDQYPAYHIINLDKLTYAGSKENMSDFVKDSRHTFVQGDICDQKLLSQIFASNRIDGVIHFAAESHVDRSIEGPDAFVQTNIVGTYFLLEAAKKAWERTSSGQEESPRFHHISTDEVYGSLGKEGYFNEQSPYAPNSPYSASKAASDHLVRSYHHTYGMNICITHCSNNYGPLQNDEKLIPTIIRNAIEGRPIPIYGDGSNVRDWLYVADHCDAIDKVYHKGRAGETYTIGACNELDNMSMATHICEQLDIYYPKAKGSYKEQITLVADRPGHDFRYAIDATKMSKELGWKPQTEFNKGLLKTINWFVKKYKIQTV
ncbi:MAG: dTDP-glucose 4,6-dehydratase [Flavobacteriaceae bacterium]|nr:dTDP-glucose 4,6-dehydratase [Flavobacteriaceae bacterium]MDH3795520.1 dTDP-glucose 4,6-dehydratase [Flavobacteriaceae bacterium]